MFSQKFIISFILISLLFSLLPPPPLFAARITKQANDELVSTGPLAPLHIAERGGQVEFTWQLPLPSVDAASIQAVDALLQGFPHHPHEGYLLPLHTQAILVDGNSEPHLSALQSMHWPGPLRSATAKSEPPPIDDAGQPLIPALTPAASEIPTTPFFILRQGRLRGQQLIVVAISPIYATAAGLQLATSFQASIPGQLMSPELFRSLMTTQEMHNLIAGPAPSNPAAASSAVKVVVRESGLQLIRGADLLTAGLESGAPLAKFRLLNAQGAESALEIQDTDGLLDASTVVHFYAPPGPYSTRVGDRWNQQEVYWLSIEPVDGLRMQRRAVGAGSAQVRHTALGRGVWEHNRFYESTMPGVDGDHWFAGVLSALPNAAPTEIATFPVTLESHLPIAIEAGTQLTITGSARTIGPHSLKLANGQPVAELQWNINTFYESWQITTNLPKPETEFDLSMIPSTAGRLVEIYIDKILWQMPVKLEFGGQGATFWGVAGQWRYALQDLPTPGALYDISDPLQPQRLTLPWATQLEFEDGPAARHYLVANRQQPASPTLIPHTGIDFTRPSGADAIYLAPQAFFATLAPLIEHRRQQGYQVALIDLQQVYDAWSFGQVSPEAVRTMLRFAVANWSPAPIAVTLVGDSTTDPLNYTGVDNPNILPAYFAYTDPWLGEIPCEACLAQLDGDSPFDPAADASMLADIWLGRFSVQNTEQLQAVVDKILTYEAAPKRWESAYFSLYIADNYIQPDGAVDPAGNFAYNQDLVVEGDPALGIPPIQSPILSSKRLYYDPDPNGVTAAWREPDAVRARQRVIHLLQQLPSLVVFNGHANHFQLASTVRSLPEPFLFGTNDIFLLENQQWLPIVLQMTCMTGQFTYVSTSGTTIDERLQREANRGAVAVWGSAGLSVGHGHQSLLRGFHRQLWSQAAGSAPLGELTTAGYLELFTAESCCQETRLAFVLLGDPLTRARIWESGQHGLFLPLLQN